jgi:hypothetical protein
MIRTAEADVAEVIEPLPLRILCRFFSLARIKHDLFKALLK